MTAEREKSDKQNMTRRDELKTANMTISRLENQLEDQESTQREQHFYGNNNGSGQARGRRGTTVGSENGDRQSIGAQ